MTTADDNPGIRMMPNDPAAEAYLLSCCLLDGPAVIARCVSSGIGPDSFYDSKNKIIFATILDLYAAQKSTEIDALASELSASRNLQQVGGYQYLTEISSKVPTTAQVSYFVDKVRELSTVRGIIKAATQVVEQCYEFSGDLDVLLGDVSNRIGQATNQTSSANEETIQQVAGKLLDEVSAPREERKTKQVGIPWGFIDIDRCCGMLMPGSLNIVAGKPSAGKSAIADQVAWRTAKAGHETLMFTYEMTKRDKAIRIAQQESRVNLDDFDSVPADRQRDFLRSVQAIRDCPTLHVFERDTSVGRFIARCRAFANRKKVGLIVVDFLQYLARLEPSIGKERTDEKLGRLTAAVKQIARECNCPAMLLSSLNRDGYRDETRPTMASLRNSGDIESDADVIAILHWPTATPQGVEQDPLDSSQQRFYVEFNQEKGRSKGVNQVGLSFDRRATRFDNYCP